MGTLTDRVAWVTTGYSTSQGRFLILSSSSLLGESGGGIGDINGDGFEDVLQRPGRLGSIRRPHAHPAGR